MIQEILLTFAIIAAICLVFTRRTYRIPIYFGVFSLISSVIYLNFGAPDVAMAEAGISAFVTIFMIVCIERYYSRTSSLVQEKSLDKNVSSRILRAIIPLLFTAGLFGLFIYFIPTSPVSTYLKEQYLLLFMTDVGGENAVTAIYLGYRVYDTLFEALLLVTAVVAVSHMSWYGKDEIAHGRRSDVENSGMTKFTMRIICPIILVFGAYLILNGHISAGGGFLGGLTIATFFICRFLVLDIYDLPIKKVLKIEELVFIYIAVIPILAIFTGALYLAPEISPFFRNAYLIIMNALIGMKVACGFFVLFYRYIAIERLSLGSSR